jgi:ribose-phosphate pyrophosphokinase
MIRIDNEKVEINYFPDKTQRLHCWPQIHKASDILFEWKYECDEELVTLMFLVHHLRENGFDGKFLLYLEYIPNSRMDRTYAEKEVFTLKWFCKIINDLNFAKVFVLDPHSNVSPALLNNVVVDNASNEIIRTIRKIESKYNELILYFPDYSAMKKYTSFITNHKYVYGNKKRDWDTGKILGIDIVNDYNIDLNGKTILMIDDIIAYGGSMKYGADKLKELGVEKIFAYATHTENSVLDKEKGTLIKSLENGVVEKLFTTDSLFSGKHEKIEVFEL